MPANRSRTNEWRRSLQQLHERNGSVEVAVVRDDDDQDETHRHLLWRVRVLALDDDGIVIEQPSTLGRSIELQDGVELAAVFAIGQNRWMFRTRKTASVTHNLNSDRTVPAMRVEMPDTVERCQRRHYYRIETTSLTLPQVEVWPLLDPKSVVLAERACEIDFHKANGSGEEPATDTDHDQPIPFTDATMPEVGPKFTAELSNIGGGGLGLRVTSKDAAALGRHKVFWLRFVLPPDMSTPICATGKLTHSHMDSMQHTYAGMAFDFSFNPGHQDFVVEQICRYIAAQQRELLKRQAITREGELDRRKTA